VTSDTQNSNSIIEVLHRFLLVQSKRVQGYNVFLQNFEFLLYSGRECKGYYDEAVSASHHFLYATMRRPHPWRNYERETMLMSSLNMFMVVGRGEGGFHPLITRLCRFQLFTNDIYIGLLFLIFSMSSRRNAVI
jgi:hypothetical protein